MIPWGQILSKAPVWALIVSHFCHNWGTFILLTWMPTYYHQVSCSILVQCLILWNCKAQFNSLLEKTSHCIFTVITSFFFSSIIIGSEVQSYRIWAFLCFALAYNGILCKPWRVDCRYPSEQRCICHNCTQGINLFLF